MSALDRHPPSGFLVRLADDGRLEEAWFAASLLPCRESEVAQLLERAHAVAEKLDSWRLGDTDRPTPLRDFLSGEPASDALSTPAQLHRALLDERRTNWSRHAPGQLTVLLERVRAHSLLYATRGTCSCRRPERDQFVKAVSDALPGRWAVTCVTGPGNGLARTDLEHSGDEPAALAADRLLGRVGVRSWKLDAVAKQAVHIRRHPDGALEVRRLRLTATGRAIPVTAIRLEQLSASAATAMRLLSYCLPSGSFRFSTALLRQQAPTIDTTIGAWSAAGQRVDWELVQQALDAGVAQLGHLDEDTLTELARGWPGTFGDYVTAARALQLH